MVNILRHPRAKIADVQCTRLDLRPGDRLLVKVYDKLDKDQAAKLRRGIQKWAGKDVEILIYNATALDIEVDRKMGVVFGG